MEADAETIRFPPGIAGQVRGSGPALLWAHGLTSSRANEDELGLYEVTDVEGFRVVRWDAPGHGESRPVADDEETTWPRLAEVMLEVASAAGADRFVASGASMGAATSLWAAVTDPDRVEAMVLVIPPTAWETRAAQRALYLEGADGVGRDGVRAYLDQIAQRPLNPTLGELATTMRAVQRASLLGRDATCLAHVLRGAAASDLPPREDLARLEIPTLVLSWEGDPQHPMSTGTQLAEILPDATLHRGASLAEVRAWNEIARTWLRARV